MSLYYVQSDGDKFIRHIHDIEPTRWDEDNYCRVAKLTPEQREKFGVHPLKLTTPPAYDQTTQTRENGPALLVDGQWVQNWVVTDLGAEAIDAMTAAQWESVRALRNTKLENCDWTQLPDAPVDAAAWAAYRQELRDITNQPDPFNITWPQEPE